MVKQVNALQLNNTAQQILKSGRKEEALELFRQSCAMKRQLHGEESVHYCISYSGLCDCLYRLGRLEEAAAETRRFEFEVLFDSSPVVFAVCFSSWVLVNSY